RQGAEGPEGTEGPEDPEGQGDHVDHSEGARQQGVTRSAPRERPSWGPWHSIAGRRMAEVGLVLHQHRPLVRDVAQRAVDWLTANGHAVRVTVDDADLVEAATVVPDDGFAPGLDLVVSLG